MGVGWAILQEKERNRGLTLATLSVIAAVLIVVLWRLQSRRLIDESPIKSDSTILSKAYRTASAKLTPELLTMLSKLENGMWQSAARENWTFDKVASEAANQAAKEALSKKHWPAALKELAKSIDLLMPGLQQHRKQVARKAEEAKNGNGAPAAGSTAS